MKFVVFLAVFASIICYGHSSYNRHDHLECYTNAECTTKNYSNYLHHDFQDEICEGQCAAWQCMVDNVMYQVFGCDDDINICSNKDETDSKFSKYYAAVTCKKDTCSLFALRDVVSKLGDVDRSELMDSECNATKGERLGTRPFSPTTTKPIWSPATSKEPRRNNALPKNQVLKIAVGMVLFGWYFVARI